MIELYFSPTPNGLKIRLCLEEAGLEYRIHPVRLSAGEQHAPEFLARSPNGKIPVIVDHAPAAAGAPVTVFESGATPLYLAEKSGRLWPLQPGARMEAMQWLFWQVSALGPMAGQAGYFRVLRACAGAGGDRALHTRAATTVRRARPPPARPRLHRR